MTFCMCSWISLMSLAPNDVHSEHTHTAASSLLALSVVCGFKKALAHVFQNRCQLCTHSRSRLTPKEEGKRGGGPAPPKKRRGRKCGEGEGDILTLFELKWSSGRELVLFSLCLFKNFTFFEMFFFLSLSLHVFISFEKFSFSFLIVFIAVHFFARELLKKTQFFDSSF